MSLIDDAMEPVTILNKITAPDGMGGTTTTWQDGATIQAAITFDTSTQMKIALSVGVQSAYTVTTKKGIINFQYHDVIRRESDKKILRITSDGDDLKTLASADLDMNQVTAEEWGLPNG